MNLARIFRALTAAALFAVPGCDGRDPASILVGRFSTLGNTFLGTTRKPNDTAISFTDTSKFAALRSALQDAGQPVLFVTVNSLGFVDFVSPIGSNAGVQTWSSARKVNVSMRDDVLVATRGFGNDLMSAVVPPLALISSGNGQFSRSYFALDGGDHTMRSDYSCQFSQSANQTLTILGAIYATRTVLESCSGQRNSFQNEYWFDQNGRLRQSKQYFAVRNTSLLIQRIID